MEEMLLRAFGEAVSDLLAMWGDLPDELIGWDGPVAGSDGSILALK